MPIATGAFHDQRLFEQYTRNLVGLQSDINRNAQTHRTMALAQAPDLLTLKGFIADCIAQYQRRAQWMTDLQADATKRARIQAALSRMGMTLQDIAEVATPLRAAVIAFNAAPKETYAQIIAACDALLVAVDAPLSLWPE